MVKKLQKALKLQCLLFITEFLSLIGKARDFTLGSKSVEGENSQPQLAGRS